jgi:hypothetical protein
MGSYRRRWFVSEWLQPSGLAYWLAQCPDVLVAHTGFKPVGSSLSTVVHPDCCQF